MYHNLPYSAYLLIAASSIRINRADLSRTGWPDIFKVLQVLDLHYPPLSYWRTLKDSRRLTLIEDHLELRWSHQ